jgi:hypothetical protein
VKARSKASRNILTRLQSNGDFDVVVFGDKVILDEGKLNSITGLSILSASNRCRELATVVGAFYVKQPT